MPVKTGMTGDFYLEIYGFLSFGLIHRYINSLTRIRLLAEYGSVDDPLISRSSLEKIIEEIDVSASKALLKTLFSDFSPVHPQFVRVEDFASDLCEILKYSCRNFNISFSCSMADRISARCELEDVISFIILPVMLFCSLNTPESADTKYYMKLMPTSGGQIQLVHRFPRRSGMVSFLTDKYGNSGKTDPVWEFSSTNEMDSLIIVWKGDGRKAVG